MTESESIMFEQAILKAENKIGIKPCLTAVVSTAKQYDNLNISINRDGEDCEVRLVYQNTCHVKSFEGRTNNAISYMTQIYDVLNDYLN